MTAREEVLKYESSALCAIGIRLRPVMDDSNKHFSKDIDKLFDFYENDDYGRWLFEPKTQEDITNFFIWIKLKEAVGYTNICKMKVGEKYWCYISPDNNSTYVFSMEDFKKKFEDSINFIECSFKETVSENSDSSKSN